MDEIILAIDPGRDKAGIAVVGRASGTLVRMVVPADQCAKNAIQLAHDHGVSKIVVGDRTASADVVKALTSACGIEIVTVDEHRSSMEGRERYLRENPGRGFTRILPVGLRTPDRPFDDYVAEILAARYFRREAKREE